RRLRFTNFVRSSRAAQSYVRSSRTRRRSSANRTSRGSSSPAVRRSDNRSILRAMFPGATTRGIAIAVAIAILTPHAHAAEPADRIWFCPGPGTLDYIRLFQHPEEWPHARALIDVFKVYQGHTQTPPPVSFLPDSFDAFASAGVFRTLTQWNKKIAIEAGAVKEFY